MIQFDMIDQECAIVEDREPVEIYPDNADTVGAFVDTLRNAPGAIGLKIHQDAGKVFEAREAKALTPLYDHAIA